ncbi:peroxisomal acyl-coenzyme A oxidase 3-like [Bradysia coprophila]|uniref:peroxisomal acyl-coenzyme A oxidase 3-like n=1 Tax=Bradysia coprophila TaxID=38358 RepID=UPI00187DCFF6|nr:peroxisomal acyl-coenzyme A oxidase 3-like [Bradysia coprophila]
MSSTVDTSFIPDLPKGPLDTYRSRAKFDWKKLRLIFEDSNSLKIKYKTWNTLEADPLFAKPRCTLSADEQKRRAAMQMNRMTDFNLVPPEIYDLSYKHKTKYLMSINEALHSICPSFSVKIALGIGLFNNALNAMGSERHLEYYKAAWNREIVTCLAITEVSHGSNTKLIRTTATFDPKTQEFIINTPDFEAAKCWIGNLGKTCTLALLFAILYTADGTNHGLHGFLVPIRDPRTLQPYPGVLVGDIGEKIGLNGIDNGFVMFNHYRIPRENLLNRTGDVTPEGEYESAFTEPGKMLGAALESFSDGRLGIMQESAGTFSHAAVISIRYAALRKQFGPDRSGPEVPIIEYQLHQWRIFPYLAAACVFRVSVFALTDIYLETVEKSQADSNGFQLLTQKVSEIHALVSSSKPLLTWTARDAIQEAREACGGHGYLKAANLGELRNNHDACVTYEGDKNVLGQQASNWLIRQWEKDVESPAGTANFIKNRNEISGFNFENILKRWDVKSFEFIICCYEWLMCWLLQSISKTMAEKVEQGVDRFAARNNVQAYKARDLTRAYAEYYALKSFQKRLTKSDVTPDVQPYLHTIFLIYGYWCRDKHMTTFYQGNFATGASFADTIRNNLLQCCSDIKDVSVSIVDALAPPDFALNSVLGKSDGLLYQNLQHEFMTNPGALERASWWQDVVIPPKSKL